MEDRRDSLLRALAAEGNVRVVAVSGAGVVAEAQRVHALSRVATAALGRQLLMTAMMASELKHESERVSTIIRGDGPGGSMVCTGSADCAVKGYIVNGQIELPPTKQGKLDVAGLVGTKGKLTVVRDMSMREPYVGTCNLVSGEIAEDFANYYAASCQQPSLLYLGVRLEAGTGRVLSAGGLLAQPLPDCPDGVIESMQSRAGQIGELTKRLGDGFNLEEAVKAALGTLDVQFAGSFTPVYRCDCSRGRIEQALIATGREEIDDMVREDGGAEVTCHFCNAVYRFTAEELLRLVQDSER